MFDDQDDKDRPDEGHDPLPGWPFIEHLLNQPEGPETPRTKVMPRDVEFDRPNPSVTHRKVDHGEV